MKFPKIERLEDLAPFVADKKEIRFAEHHNGVTIGCYMFMDSRTFDSPHALECRGIAFDSSGAICSRPLHKFFNVGEKDWLTPERIRALAEAPRTMEKLDGSMISTAWVNGELAWRSKKSFTSDVVRLTKEFLAGQPDESLTAFATTLAASGYTATFELTHPLARIVVGQDEARLRLLHVRENITGAYVMLDPQSHVHELIARYNVPCVPIYEAPVTWAFDSLEGMKDQEGYVLQFGTGDMAKLKCPWYARLHRSITFLRERDIALASLSEDLDDLKATLAEAGIDLTPVNEVEARVKALLLTLMSQIDEVMTRDGGLGRKEFAIANSAHPLFGLLMAQYLGKELNLSDWFIKHRLKDEFSLRVLADGALADAIEA
jgi:RNA ligase